MTIRVGVNLLWLVPGEVGGSGEYTIRLLDAVSGLDSPGIDLTLFVNGSLALDPSCEALMESHHTVLAPTDGRSRARRIAVETTWMRSQARRHSLDLMHEAGGTIALWPEQRTLVTIHDLQPLTTPENFSWPKRSYMRLMLPRTARSATRIATLTEFVARDVAERLHVDPSRFLRVPPGTAAPAPASEAETKTVAAAYSLNDDIGRVRPFFVYPAVTYPHKNHELLVRSFAAVCRKHPEVLLVLPGGSAQREGDLNSLIDRLGVSGNVRRTGRIPRRDLEVLYQLATALTFASRYEGCGIPVIEAMAAGCPVIASDCTGLPEMVGDAGVLIDPDDVDGWSRAMVQMLDYIQERARFVDLGTTRALRFDWTGSAEALVAAYRAVAEA